MKTYQYRDLSITEFHQSLIITACDSSAGVGEKPGDELRVLTKYIAMFAARVCFFELLSVGATIIAIANTVCGEMHPTGEAMIQGIQEELCRAGVENVTINGSTEENFKTSMTGFGIFVMGSADALRVSPSSPEDVVICIGKPRFGAGLNVEGDDEIVNYKDLKTLIALDQVNEIIPCGSKGILYEAQNLASIHGLTFYPEVTDLDLIGSSGPATTVIASVKPSLITKLSSIFGTKMTIIGQLQIK
ncbi:MAG: alpha-ribazole-5-phosphate synthase [Eubacteriaceae bacterium]|nr:alpha-ribazole-5-phosphate synthase [Eubacteriaceae bacterium]